MQEGKKKERTWKANEKETNVRRHRENERRVIPKVKAPLEATRDSDHHVLSLSSSPWVDLIQKNKHLFERLIEVLNYIIIPRAPNTF